MENGTEIVVSNKHVEAQYVEMMVPLYSYGCEKKVKKSLAHLKGIYSITVDYNQQKVTVWGICNKHDVLSTVKTKRKEARFWKSEDNIVIEMEKEQRSPSTSPSPSLSKPSLALMKAWKKVFTRSHSF